MISRVFLTTLLLVGGCKEVPDITEDHSSSSSSELVETANQYGDILAPLIDPAKLDSLKGKRAGTKRLRKASYWLEIAQREGHELEALLQYAHDKVGTRVSVRRNTQIEALIRNKTILSRLGCFDAEGMIKLRKGNAPTITKGPYAGELATVDHIIPRSICPELDNRLFNLEFLPETLNRQKSNKISQRQRDLARQWHDLGLLSNKGLKQVLTWPR